MRSASDERSDRRFRVCVLRSQSNHFAHRAHRRRQLSLRDFRLRWGGHQIDLLPLSFRTRQDHALSLRVHAERLAADLARQIERRLWHAVLRQLQRVRRHARLQRPLHLLRGAEESIRRRRAFDPLVGPLEVVMIDEQPDALLRIAQVDEHRALDALTPQ